MCLVGACQPTPTPTPNPDFKDAYTALQRLAVEQQAQERQEQRVTFSAEGMPMQYFLRWVSDQAAVSIVADEALDKADVTVDVVDVPISQLLSSVARRLGVQLTRTGTVYFLGEGRPEDRGVLVRKVVRLDAESLTSAIGVLLGEHGRSQVQDDGLVIVGDRVEVLEKVINMLDQVESAPIDAWVVQLFLVSVNDRWEQELGIDVEQAVDVATTFALASGGDNNIGEVQVSAELNAALAATLNADQASVVAQPLFVLVDGSESRFSDGQSIPIPQRSTSAEGTVTTESFEYVDIGINALVAVRDVGRDRALLHLDIELTTLAGFVEEAPIISGERFDTQAVIQSSGVYLLGQLTTDTRNNGRRGQLGLVSTYSEDRGNLQVWARSYRIGGPSGVEDPDREAAGRNAPEGSLMVQADPHQQDRWHVARELAERDGKADDQAYIRWLATGEWTGTTGRFE